MLLWWNPPVETRCRAHGGLLGTQTVKAPCVAVHKGVPWLKPSGLPCSYSKMWWWHTTTRHCVLLRGHKMTGGRASRGMSPDAGAAVSSNTPAQLVPHAVGDRKVPQWLGLFGLSPSTSALVTMCYLVMTWTYMVSFCSCSHIAPLKIELMQKKQTLVALPDL